MVVKNELVYEAIMTQTGGCASCSHTLSGHGHFIVRYLSAQRRIKEKCSSRALCTANEGKSTKAEHMPPPVLLLQEILSSTA